MRRHWPTWGLLRQKKNQKPTVFTASTLEFFWGGGGGQEVVRGPCFHESASEWEVLRHKPWHDPKYSGADKSLARPTSRCILFDGENISFDAFLLLLLQSALQPLWVLAWSTIVEYSQQEGFYRVPLPAARQTPNLEDQWLERSNSRHQVCPTSETKPANTSSGRWNYGREIVENFAESGDFHVMP